MTLVDHLPILQVIVPMLMAPLVLMLQPRGLAWAASATAVAFSFVIAINLTARVLAGYPTYYELGGWQAPFGIALQVDEFSAIMLLIVNGAAAVAILAGRESINTQIEAHRQPMFYAAWLLAVAGLSGMVVSADAFNIFVFMEISSLSAYILIAGGPDRRALLAVFKYLIMGTIGATFYLIGVGLIYMMTGTLNLEDMSERIGDVGDEKPILIAAGFITLGLALKAALFPLHVWLPNAYAHAPHMVTVFLAACGTKVAIYVLIRIDFFVFQGSLDFHAIHFSLFLMPLALLGIVVASAVAVFEGHIKRVLAFSSVAQIGYILLGASLLSVDGVSASLIHMFNHALAKSALFLVIACLGLRYLDLHVDALAGAAKQMPITCAAFVVAGLSLIGVPGTAGFISKWALIQALMAQGEQGLLMVGIVLISSLMALAYVWRIVETMYFGEPSAEQVDVHREAPWPMLSVLLIVVGLNLYFGFFPELSMTLANDAAEILVSHSE